MNSVVVLQWWNFETNCKNTHLDYDSNYVYSNKITIFVKEIIRICDFMTKICK